MEKRNHLLNRPIWVSRSGKASIGRDDRIYASKFSVTWLGTQRVKEIFILANLSVSVPEVDPKK